VGGEGSTGDFAETGEDVNDTGGEAGLLYETCGKEGAEGCLLGGLEDYGVTAGNGGANLPRPHEEGEVPWNDLGADTDLGWRQSLLLCM